MNTALSQVMGPSQHEPFSLNGTTVEPGQNRIGGDRVDAKAMDVLVALVNAAPAVVTKRDLLDLVWSDVVVADGVVHRAIALIRKSLGDDPKRPRFIETIPRRGYRLITPVEQRQIQRDLPVPPDQRSIAVLPFQTEPEADLAYLGEGIAEEVLIELATSTTLKVSAKGSSWIARQRYDDIHAIAAALGVSYVFDGSLKRFGHRLRIHAELIRAEDCSVEWAARYDIDPSELSGLEDDIARRLAVALSSALSTTISESREKLSHDPQAYDACLRGWHHWERQDLPSMHRAIELFELALQHDERCFAALLGLHNAATVAVVFGAPREEMLTKARAALDRAESLALTGRQRGDLDVAITDLERFLDWNLGYDAHERTWRQKLLANPKDLSQYGGYATEILRAGYLAEALRFYQRNEEVDPLSAYVKQWMGEIYGSLGQLDAADDKLSRALDIDPGNLLSLAYRTVVRARARDAEGSADDLRQVYAVLGETHSWSRLLAANRLTWLGEPDAALAAVKVKTDDSAPFLTGLTLIALGQLDAGFDWWDKAFVVQDEIMRHIKLHAAFFCPPAALSALIESARFQQVLAELKLDTGWCSTVGRRAADLTPVTGIEIGVSPLF